MTEFNPSVVTIEKVERHPDADALDIATVNGYPIVIKRDQYKVGQLVSYIPIDSVVDVTNPVFSFLSKPRIKAMRLRGVYSQGLLVDAPEGMKEGDSVQEFFGIKKFVYPEEMEEYIGISEEEKKKFFFPDQKGLIPRQIDGGTESNPQGWKIPYYDLDALRKYKKLFTDGEEVVIMQKLDGENFSSCHDGDRLWVKSRNLYKRENPESKWWEVANRYNLKEKLAKYPMHAFFFEKVGSVTPFFYDCEVVNGSIQTKLYGFDIVNVKTGNFLDWQEAKSIFDELELPMAPVVYIGPWKEDCSLFELAEHDNVLKSNHPKATVINEGIVIRPIKERIDNRLGRVILKLKSERYNLFKK